MAETVFILGAGASAHAGAPVMANFLQRARLIESGGFPLDKNSFRLVDEAQIAAQKMTLKVDVDIGNIEALFNALEIGELINSFPLEKGGTVREAISALRTVIAQTLEYSITFPIRKGSDPESERGPDSTRDYLIFAELLKDLTDDTGEGLTYDDITIITFNYDTALEVALHRSDVPFHYHLYRPASPSGIALLKLHGSINWWQCCTDDCATVNEWPIEKVLGTPAALNGIGTHNPRRVTPYSARQHCNEACPACNGSIAKGAAPLLIPPTWNKTVSSSAIAPVWTKAAESLSNARKIIIVGYSFPQTDEYFRMLLSIGLANAPVLEAIRVIDIGPIERVDTRYRSILSKQAIRSYKFIQKPFGNSLRDIISAVTPDSSTRTTVQRICDRVQRLQWNKELADLFSEQLNSG